jgi:hypothetical protein
MRRFHANLDKINNNHITERIIKMAKPNWAIKESETAKKKLLGINWKTKVNTYLWFCIGDVKFLNEKEMEKIKEKFFVNQEKISFGDIELHESMVLSGKQILLRLRGDLILHPSLKIERKYCPLYQVGHFDIADRKSNDRDINFYNEWK